MRDLKWTVECPSLIRVETGFESLVRADLIEQLRGEDQLQEFLSPASGTESHYPRVGYYFESLVHFWLKEVCGYELVDQGKQIIRDGVTRGELDFIFRDASGQLHHLETAVKFYLHFAKEHSSGSHFIGPNSTDNFERKVKRLREHQLPMSDGLYEEPLRKWAWVKGRIFYHPLDMEPDEIPQDMNPDHSKAHWIFASQLDGWSGWFPEKHCRLVRKPHWLSLEQGETSEHDLSVDDSIDRLKKHFKGSDTPRLIACMKQEEDSMMEARRVFVVSDSWPGK